MNARVKAVIRRKNLKGNNTIEFQNVVLNIHERTFKVEQNDIHLNRKEFDLIYYFLINKNRLITKSALAEFVWGNNSDQSDNFDFVYYQIKNLRKKLAEAKAEIHIEAVYGMGYKLTEQ